MMHSRESLIVLLHYSGMDFPFPQILTVYHDWAGGTGYELL